MPDRAVGEARTRDPQLGKLMLYQLATTALRVQMYTNLSFFSNFGEKIL